MAFHSIFIQPKNNQKFPEEIYKKAEELVCLFNNMGEWDFSEKCISFHSREMFFDLEGELQLELDGNHISRNMVDFYNWVCKNADVHSECWNASDLEFGPHDIETFMESVQGAVKSTSNRKGSEVNTSEGANNR